MRLPFFLRKMVRSNRLLFLFSSSNVSFGISPNIYISATDKIVHDSWAVGGPRGSALPSANRIGKHHRYTIAAWFAPCVALYRHNSISVEFRCSENRMASNVHHTKTSICYQLPLISMRCDCGTTHCARMHFIVVKRSALMCSFLHSFSSWFSICFFATFFLQLKQHTQNSSHSRHFVCIFIICFCFLSLQHKMQRETILIFALRSLHCTALHYLLYYHFHSYQPISC